ncbi:EF-hand domain-containing protein [Thalassococcus sp. S3]|uniref:EF-hand domain-containing protein n=1 Tax=Thalassococcus sp. S3 TaxID=2017482 RepID=UPI001024004F|nr:hypothetical protein [Thalassococcus sp. S3]QBF32744.1 hypothetical protein CFI11_16200 [Thalassococcus sp. S3]
MRHLLLILALAGSPATADPAEEAFGSANLQVLEGSLPHRVLQRLRKSPSRFLEEAAGLILGYGGPRGIDANGIRTSIAVQRAHIRAREIRKMLLADLDGDGRVTQEELRALIAASAARSRGALLLFHKAADRDDDGIVTLDEMRRQAQTVALADVTEADEALLLSFMSFDLDENGFVSLEEIGAAITVLGAKT